MLRAASWPRRPDSRSRGPLVQVGAFGDPGRDPRGWTVSIAFSGSVGEDLPPWRVATMRQRPRGTRSTRFPDLAFDHNRDSRKSGGTA
jgi:8-oxo-dGTP diphosphatase